MDLNPEGSFELIFQVNGSFSQRSYGGDEWQIRPKDFVGGLHSKSFQIKSMEKAAKIISVRFKPLGARFFMPDKLNLFKNALVDMNDIHKEIDHLELENASATSIGKRLDLFLMASYKDYTKNILDEALKLIVYSRGFLPIKEVCQKLNCSESYLRRMFNEQIGTSPKGYSKILRINYINGVLNENKYGSLTRLSHDLGYFDQSHFIKDYKSVTGRSPKQYLKTN